MSQPLIIGAVSIAVIDTVVGDLSNNAKQGPSFRIVIGGFIVLVTLLALSDYQEDVADSLAIVILLATFFGPKGGALSTVLTKLTSKDYVPPASLGTPIVQLPGYVDPNAKYQHHP